MKPIWHEHTQVGAYHFNEMGILGNLLTIEVRVYAETIILHDRKTDIIAARCHASLSDEWDFDWRPADLHYCETLPYRIVTDAEIMRHVIALADTLASRVAASIPPDDLRTAAELRAARQPDPEA